MVIQGHSDEIGGTFGIGLLWGNWVGMEPDVGRGEIDNINRAQIG